MYTFMLRSVGISPHPSDTLFEVSKTRLPPYGGGFAWLPRETQLPSWTFPEETSQACESCTQTGPKV